MNIQIQTGEGAPLYQQIVNQVKYLIASGQLEPGEELLPIRSLAELLVINPNTVARAYLELERSGVVVKKRGSGTFVADKPPTISKRQQRDVLDDRIDLLLTEARQLGVSQADLIEMIHKRAERMAVK